MKKRTTVPHQPIPNSSPKKKTWRHVKDIPADTLAKDLKEFLDKAPASTSPEPTAEPANAQSEAQAPPANVTMAGFSNTAEGHRVTMAFHAPAPGACLLYFGTNEARLLARSILEWAQYCEDREAGKKP